MKEKTYVKLPTNSAVTFITFIHLRLESVLSTIAYGGYRGETGGGGGLQMEQGSGNWNETINPTCLMAVRGNGRRVQTDR